MNAGLSYLREQLAAKKTTEAQNLNTDMQNLLTRIASHEEEKTKLQELLEAAREEAANLRRDLQESQQTVSNTSSRRTRLPIYTAVHPCLQNSSTI